MRDNDITSRRCSSPNPLLCPARAPTSDSHVGCVLWGPCHGFCNWNKISSLEAFYQKMRSGINIPYLWFFSKQERLAINIPDGSHYKMDSSCQWFQEPVA